MRDRQAISLIAAAAIVGIFTAVPGSWDGVGAWSIRAACVGLWVWLAVRLISSQLTRPALVAPLFLIVTSALWFYVIIPVVFATVSLSMNIPIVAELTATLMPNLPQRFVQSEGEIAILQFVLCGIVAMALVLSGASNGVRTGRDDADAQPPLWLVLGLGLGSSALFASLSQVRDALSGQDWAELLRQAQFAALTAFLVAVGLATMRVAVGAPRSLPVAVALAGAAGALFFSGVVKLVVMAAAVALLLVALTRRSRLALVSAVAMPLLILLVGKSFLMSELDGFAFAMTKVAVSKVVGRQMESVDCLTGVIRHQELTPEASTDALYFAGAVVPRVLWPTKPDLSQSGKTILQYCHPILAGNLNTTHSGSGTLLWEPLAFGGLAGATIAQGLVLLILAAMSRLWINGRDIVAAGVLSLAPWAIDFDQHFALYLANLIKAGLVAGLCIALMSSAGRKRPQ